MFDSFLIEALTSLKEYSQFFIPQWGSRDIGAFFMPFPIMTTSFVVVDMSVYAGVIYFSFINLFVILSSVLLINLSHGFIFVVCKFFCILCHW